MRATPRGGPLYTWRRDGGMYDISLYIYMYIYIYKDATTHGGAMGVCMISISLYVYVHV